MERLFSLDVFHHNTASKLSINYQIFVLINISYVQMTLLNDRESNFKKVS